MTTQQENTKRIAKNTLMLYVRMLFGMLISLYTSRVVLQTLGVEDYGIYNVVGGVVAMLGFLNASMSGATSRFLAFEIGKGNQKKVSETFSSALIIHIGIALVILIISETIGLWFLENKLIIPDARLNAARIVYQFSIFSTLVGITQVPYDACIIAREKMNVYAYVEILNVCLKLLIVYILLIGNYDKLILYAFLQFFVSLLVMLIYRIYSLKNYPETKFHLFIKKDRLIPMLNFSGWDMLGNISMIVRGQGINMLMNMFFGPKINASAGIASSVMSVTTSFSGNFLMAVKPYITKLYAKENYSELVSSIFFSSKMAYLLVAMFAIPIIVECDFILKLWLSYVPDYAVSFCQLVLIQQIIASTSQPVIQAIHATAKIRFLSIFNGMLNILILPMSYYLFMNSILDPNICYLLNVLMTIIAIISNMCNLSSKMYFPLLDYLRKVIVPCYVSAVSILFLLKYVGSFFDEGWGKFGVILLLYIVIFIITSYYIIFNASERLYINSFILKIKKKWLQR